MIRTGPSYPSNMGQRNMLFNNQILGLVIDPGQSTFHQEHHIFLRDTNGPAYPRIHPMLSSLGSTANLNLYPSFGNHDSNMFFGNRYDVSGDPSSFNWSYMPHMPYLQGRSVSGCSLEIGRIAEHEYRNTMSSNNFIIILHPYSIHYHNYHSPPLVQGIHGHQMPAPFYRHSMNENFHHRIVRNRGDGRESVSTYPLHFYRPQRRVSQYASIEITGLQRTLPSEEVAVLEFPSMQPHTNDASYEAKYEENDKIRILRCGHDYHVDCIKQWLLLKNVCPMCKRPAFPMDNTEC